MTQRTLLDRLLSPAGFGLVLLFFLLPFVSVSCQPASSSPVMSTFTGLDLIVGGAPEVTGMRTEPEADEAERAIVTGFRDRLDLEPLAVLAALAILIGMTATGFTRRRARHGAGAGLAALAAALLVAAQVRVVDRLDEAIRSAVAPGEQVPGIVHTRYGFWLSVIFLGFVATGHAVALARSGPKATAPDERPGDDGPAGDRRPEDDRPADDRPAPDAAAMEAGSG